MSKSNKVSAKLIVLNYDNTCFYLFIKKYLIEPYHFMLPNVAFGRVNHNG